MKCNCPICKTSPAGFLEGQAATFLTAEYGLRSWHRWIAKYPRRHLLRILELAAEQGKNSPTQEKRERYRKLRQASEAEASH